MNSSRSSATRIRYACPDYGQAAHLAVRDVLTTGMVGPGALTQKFESELERGLSLDSVLATNSGSAALLLALRDNIPTASQVGVPAFTYTGTINAIVEAGLFPVFLDIDPNTLCVSRETIQARAGELDALLVVHIGGHIVQPSEWEPFNLPTIHDAAHAFNPLAFRRTDKVCFSFGPIKNLSCGMGGAYAGASSQAFFDSQNGRVVNDVGVLGGFNMRMADLNAAIGLAQLDSFYSQERRRQAILRCYRLAGLPLIQSDLYNHAHLAIVHVEDNEAIQAGFAKRGIETQIHYTPRNNAWLNKALHTEDLPNTKYATKHCLSLPLHSKLSDADVTEIILTFKELTR